MIILSPGKITTTIFKIKLQCATSLNSLEQSIQIDTRDNLVEVKVAFL